MSVLLAGCDFSSSPGPRKPIVMATGRLERGRVHLLGLESLTTLQAYADWLSADRSWVCGFDFPFGLPRELVVTLGWPQAWLPCMRHYASLSRAEIRQIFAAFCQARPAGGKFAHRATDGPAGSSPSMKWVNPPVAYMMHAGVPPLIEAGVHLPGLYRPPDAPGRSVLPRIGLEAYPGLLARELLGPIGQRRSYKSDDKSKQTADRLIARKDMLTALENGQTRLGLRIGLSHAQRDALVDDASGDRMDAVLCLVQAAWAQGQHVQGHPCYGLPDGLDPLEGWILSA
jgi:hypothetical protein